MFQAATQPNTENIMNLNIGDKVKHPSFGNGKVVEIYGRFKQKQRKKIMLSDCYYGVVFDARPKKTYSIPITDLQKINPQYQLSLF